MKRMTFSISVKFKSNVFVLPIFLALFFASLFWGRSAMAVTIIKDYFPDVAARTRGFTATSDDSALRVGFLPSVLTGENHIVIKRLDSAEITLHNKWQVESDIYQIEILNPEAIKAGSQMPFLLETKKNITELKKIFIWDKEKEEESWQEYPTEIIKENVVRGKFKPAERIKLVLLSHQEILGIGEASWYKYKNCDCAASPDYPKGTKLLVKSLENNKEVVVKVNDFGPDRLIFPKRIIDLDKRAFMKLGNLRAGILKKIIITKLE